LFRNVAPKRGHWLKVSAIDPQLKRDAYGAEVTLHAGAKTWLRVLNPAESFLCSGPPILHFGLGAATHVDYIEVRWPDGVMESFRGPDVTETNRRGYPADQHITLRKGNSRNP